MLVFYSLKVAATQNSDVKNEADFYQDSYLIISSIVKSKSKYSVLKRENAGVKIIVNYSLFRFLKYPELEGMHKDR